MHRCAAAQKSQLGVGGAKLVAVGRDKCCRVVARGIVGREEPKPCLVLAAAGGARHEIKPSGKGLEEH